MTTITTHSVHETQRLGQTLGRSLGPGQIIALNGELGAGKTALTQGIAQGLGIPTPVTSPTFTLVNEYETAQGSRLIHIDSYRLGDLHGDETAQAALEAATFGLEEILEAEDTIIVIEWAARVASLLPTDHLEIRLAHVEDELEQRLIQLIGHGEQSKQLISQII